MLLAMLTLAAVIWAIMGTGASLANLGHALSNMSEFLHRLWPPDLTWDASEARPFSPPLRLAATAVAVTLQISLLGTVLGAAGALVLGLLAAENLTPHWLHHPIKVLLALVRSVPIILLALLFVAAIGLGPMPGVLAVAVHSLGMLGKLYSDEFETADPGVWEALDSAGANWLQKIRFALWPQAARQILSHTLFRLEMNVRESAVLGLVGVAGLGLWIENYRRAFDYRSVATMVMVTMLVVLAMDQVVFHARRRLK
jgi:phosphonate transport system permease protein